MCAEGRLRVYPRRPLDTRYADKELKRNEINIDVKPNNGGMIYTQQ